MRRQENNISTVGIPILAIVDYILLLGYIWGSIAFSACLYTNLPAAYAAIYLGALTGAIGIALLIFLFIKNRFFGLIVLGSALFSYGIASIAGGALSENQTLMILLIVLGIILIGLGAGSFVLALNESNKRTEAGGLDLGHVDHRGVVFGQHAGVDIQTNRGPTISNV